MSNEVKPDELFKYATAFAQRSEAKGKGTVYPTFRQAANRFRTTLDAIEQACSDWDSSKGYMQPAVAVRSGNGVGELERGQWMVEAYSEA